MDDQARRPKPPAKPPPLPKQAALESVESVPPSEDDLVREEDILEPAAPPTAPSPRPRSVPPPLPVAAVPPPPQAQAASEVDTGDRPSRESLVPEDDIILLDRPSVVDSMPGSDLILAEIVRSSDDEIIRPSDSEITRPNDSARPSDDEIIRPSDSEITRPNDSEITRPKGSEVVRPGAEGIAPSSAEVLITDADVSDRPSRDSLVPEDDIIGGRIHVMYDRLKQDDYQGALMVAESLLEREPDHLDALQCREMCHNALCSLYQSRLGSLERIPQLALESGQAAQRVHDPRAEKVLRRVNGLTSASAIVVGSDLPPPEALRILSELYLQGVIEFEDE